mgnify:CR=1 FL=1
MHTFFMARKIVRKTDKKIPQKITPKPRKKASSPRKKEQSIDLTQFLIPAVVAFLAVWVFTGSLQTAGIVFIAVLFITGFGQTYRKK